MTTTQDLSPCCHAQVAIALTQPPKPICSKCGRVIGSHSSNTERPTTQTDAKHTQGKAPPLLFFYEESHVHIYHGYRLCVRKDGKETGIAIVALGADDKPSQQSNSYKAAARLAKCWNEHDELVKLLSVCSESWPRRLERLRFAPLAPDSVGERLAARHDAALPITTKSRLCRVHHPGQERRWERRYFVFERGSRAYLAPSEPTRARAILAGLLAIKNRLP